MLRVKSPKSERQTNHAQICIVCKNANVMIVSYNNNYFGQVSEGDGPRHDVRGLSWLLAISTQQTRGVINELNTNYFANQCKFAAKNRKRYHTYLKVWFMHIKT